MKASVTWAGEYSCFEEDETDQDMCKTLHRNLKCTRFIAESSRDAIKSPLARGAAHLFLLACFVQPLRRVLIPSKLALPSFACSEFRHAGRNVV